MIDLVEYLHDMADDLMGMEAEDRLILGECAKRITELEAALKRQKHAAEDYMWAARKTPILKAQLEAVKLLPEKWRKHCGKHRTSANHLKMECAEELDKAIGGSKDE